MASLDTNISTFNLLATPTTVNAFAGASVALNIGNASAAAAFPGGITVASGKTLTLTGATVAGAPTWSSSQAITLSTAAQPNVTSVGTLTSLATSGVFNYGLRATMASTDRISVTSATTIYSQTLGGSSVGASASLFLVNGYQVGTATTSFSDLVMFINGQTPTVFGAVNRGGPVARTYTASGAALQLAMAGSVNYNVAVSSIEQAN